MRIQLAVSRNRCTPITRVIDPPPLLFNSFILHYGCKVGCLQYNKTLITYQGHAAIEILAFLGEELPETHSKWIPKHLSNKFKRLPDSYFIGVAKRYETIIEWMEGNSGEYQHVMKHRRHLRKECTSDMTLLAGIYQVYAYEFSDKSAYIGLTCNPKKRHEAHCANGPVFRKRSSGISFEFKILREGLNSKEACNAEIALIEEYSLNGWEMLNSHSGGGLGTIQIKYSYQDVLNEAKKYTTKVDFLRGNINMFVIANKRGWLRKLEKEFNWPKNVLYRHTFEMCEASAKKHKYIVDWLNEDKSSYNAAFQHGWLKKIKEDHFKENKPINTLIWTKEKCFEEARKWTKRRDWQYKSNNGSYRSAVVHGWLKEIGEEVFGANANPWDVRRENEIPLKESGYTTVRGKVLYTPNEPPKCDDISGKIFGKLTVLSYAGTDRADSFFLCQCSCGSPPKAISIKPLKKGLTRSCGCHRIDQMRRVGHCNLKVSFETFDSGVDSRFAEASSSA